MGPIPARHGPAERGAIYDEMNRVIAALHSVDFAARGLENYGKPGNYFERQIGRWSKQYVASVTQPIPEMDRLMEWLPAKTSRQWPRRNRHGQHRAWRLPSGQPDVPPHRKPRVIAVLDWELSTLGHPLADFSYHCMAWHIPPGAFRGIGGLDRGESGHPGRG
jgi:aminoglycoside phosphotransferase (APT) family kinase protein